MWCKSGVYKSESLRYNYDRFKEEGDDITEEKIREIVDRFAEEAKRIYGTKLQEIILYGSCARGDFENDSDIDILILLDSPLESISSERKRILEVSDKLDLDYDVVLAPVVQNYALYQKYIPVSVFYQNVEREGVKIA